MLSEEQMLAGAGLDLWFSDFIASLVGTIRQAARSGGSMQIAPQNARAFLMQIRENAAENSAELDKALSDSIRSVIDLEKLTGDLFVPAADHDRKVETARAEAIDAAGRLVEVLRSAKPSKRAQCLYPQPGEPDYHPPRPV